MPKIEAPWAKIPISLVQAEVTLADIQVYAAIDYLAGKRGWWYGSHKMIAARAGGISEKSVQRAVARLSKLGFLTSKRLGMKYHTWTQYWVLSRGVEGPSEPTIEAWEVDKDEGSDPSGMSDPIPQTSTIDLTDDDLAKNAEQVINSDPRLSMSPRQAYDHTVEINKTRTGVYNPDKYWMAWGEMNAGSLNVKDWQAVDSAIRRVKEVCPKSQHILPSPSYLPALEQLGQVIKNTRPGPVYWAIRRFEREQVTGGDLLTYLAMLYKPFLNLLREEIESNPEDAA